MMRWWPHSFMWGWLCYESARARGERANVGMAHAYFVGEGRWSEKRASTGPMMGGAGSQ